ncbi:SDR family oxidoreductase [Sphingomonas bacterium]|uniref:SDR family oxidoreductase n=1 Tax=Sphingomonas bacterium TaxID=1895847 RepID=UPI001576AF3B|nr:SDR family oxidoreductase [Sphingomonas bacterium]
MSDPVRTALVTGANKGIGLEIARQLAAAGLRVWLGARDPVLGEAAAASLRDGGGDAQFVRLDVLDPEIIAAAADTIGADGGGLDVLVNNAGVVFKGDGPPGKADPGAVRRAFDTNFFGALAVTQAMLPLLRRSASASIVNQSSSIGSLALQADPEWVYAKVKPLGYAAAKASLNMLTIQLAAELEEEGIAVNSVNPGLVRTDLNGRTRGAPVEEGAAPAVRMILSGDGRTGTFVGPDGPEPW